MYGVREMRTEEVVEKVFDKHCAPKIIAVINGLEKKYENGNWEVFECMVSNKTARIIKSRVKAFKYVLAQYYNKPFKLEINGKTVRVIVRK